MYSIKNLLLNSSVLFEDVANPESPKWKCFSEKVTLKFAI